MPWVRAAATLSANVVRGALSFVTGLVTARALGAKTYGDLAFLLATFAALATLLDCGTTSAFYTLLSARPRGRRFFIVYALWTVGVQFIATFVVIAFFIPGEALHKIWLGIDRPIVLLSLASSFVITQVWLTVMQMAEAVRKTVMIQSIAAVQVALHLLIVLAAWYLNRLTLPLLLALPIAEYVLVAIAITPSLVRANFSPRSESEETFASVVQEFARYCKPLVVYSIVSFVYAFADRWLLQRFGGAAQQGYFAIGQQFSAIAGLATVSILAVVWKEVAESFARNDHERVRTIFRGVRRGVFFFGATVGVMLLPHVRTLLTSTVGSQFAGATLCVSLMFLYPIHQALGQFQGTFLLATGATSAYSAIGIVSMIVSIPVAYALLAPPTARPPGLGLGALGLATKLVVLQFLAVTAQFWFLRRKHGVEWQWGYEVSVLAALAVVSVAAKLAAAVLAAALGFANRGLLVAAIGAALYCAVVALSLVRWPQLAGVTPLQRDAVVRIARRWMVRTA